MTMVTLDTHKAIKQLVGWGFTEDQATGITEIIQEIKLPEYVSKVDHVEFKSEMRGDFSALRTEFQELRTEFQEFKGEMKAGMADLKAELLKWYVGIAMFQTTAFLAGIIAVAKIFHP